MEGVLPRRVFEKVVGREEERTGRYLASAQGVAREEARILHYLGIGREGVLEGAQSPSLTWVVSCRPALEVEGPEVVGMQVACQIDAEPEEGSCEHCDKHRWDLAHGLGLSLILLSIEHGVDLWPGFLNQSVVDGSLVEVREEVRIGHPYHPRLSVGQQWRERICWF